MTSTRGLLQFDFDADVFVRRAPQPREPAARIIDELQRITSMHGNLGGDDPPDQETIQRIYRIFVNTPPHRLSEQFYTLRRIRQLAWGLTYSENNRPRNRRIVDDETQLRDALGLIESRIHIRIRLLFGVFDALLQTWDERRARMLREFVRRHLATYQGRQQSIQNLQENLAWYCEEDGATQLARDLLRTQVNLSQVWSYVNLPDRMHGYRYFGAVAEAYVADVRGNQRLNRAFVSDIVRFVEIHRNDITVCSIVSVLIEALGREASEHLRQPVQSYVRRNWGHPYVTSPHNCWHHVSDEARDIFAAWTNEEDVNFFFEIVAQACEDDNFEYRKAFWLAYLEHISFCRPVLRRDVQNIIRNNPRALQYYRERLPATLRGGNRNQHAFIIRMGDHTFVEFSTAGACYVYGNVRTPFCLEDSEFHMSELRNMEWGVHRVIHRDSENYFWQANFARWIRNTLGFEPMRSFRLDGADRSEWIYLSCPNENCERRLRIPAGRGRFRIRCPICERTFEYETE